MQNRFLFIFILIIAFSQIFFQQEGNASILYKEYSICFIDGQRYLCASHVVQEGEYLHKILRQRGNVLNGKLTGLSKINSHIKSFNHLKPGETILVPVKKISENEFKNQNSGKILIPFITKKTFEKLIFENSVQYNIKKGDTVSKIITRNLHTKTGSKEYHLGLKIFKYLNPEIHDLNIIVRGHEINIPNPRMVNKEWYSSLFNPEITKKIEPEQKLPLKKILPPVLKSPISVRDKDLPAFAANTMNAELESRGKLFIPFNKELKVINLKETPLIKSAFFPEIFFFKTEKSRLKNEKLLKNIYKNSFFFNLPETQKSEPNLNFKKINIQGIQIEIPFEIKLYPTEISSKSPQIFIKKNYYNAPHRFLSFLTKYGLILPSPHKINSASAYTSIKEQNQKAFIRNFLDIIKCRYNESTEISFPYKGVQVKAHTNIASSRDNKDLIIDFHDFYGDTADSLKRLHFEIVQINSRDSEIEIIKKISGELGYETIDFPCFPEDLDNKKDCGIQIKIPGKLIKKTFSKKKEYIFFPELDSSKFPEPILYYLNWLDVETVFI